jgi:hypothetical protein
MALINNSIKFIQRLHLFQHSHLLPPYLIVCRALSNGAYETLPVATQRFNKPSPFYGQKTEPRYEHNDTEKSVAREDDSREDIVDTSSDLQHEILSMKLQLLRPALPANARALLDKLQSLQVIADKLHVKLLQQNSPRDNNYNPSQHSEEISQRPSISTSSHSSTVSQALAKLSASVHSQPEFRDSFDSPIIPANSILNVPRENSKARLTDVRNNEDFLRFLAKQTPALVVLPRIGFIFRWLQDAIVEGRIQFNSALLSDVRFNHFLQLMLQRVSMQGGEPLDMNPQQVFTCYLKLIYQFDFAMHQLALNSVQTGRLLKHHPLLAQVIRELVIKLAQLDAEFVFIQPYHAVGALQFLSAFSPVLLHRAAPLNEEFCRVFKELCRCIRDCLEWERSNFSSPNKRQFRDHFGQKLNRSVWTGAQLGRVLNYLFRIPTHFGPYSPAELTEELKRTAQITRERVEDFMAWKDKETGGRKLVNLKQEERHDRQRIQQVGEEEEEEQNHGQVSSSSNNNGEERESSATSGQEAMEEQLVAAKEELAGLVEGDSNFSHNSASAAQSEAVPPSNSGEVSSADQAREGKDKEIEINAANKPISIDFIN